MFNKIVRTIKPKESENYSKRKFKECKHFKNEYWFISRTKFDEAIHKYAEEKF